MDRIISHFDAECDSDLCVCAARGVAYQRDMQPMAYESSYFEYYKNLEETPMSRTLNDARCAMLARYLPKGSRVLDYGAGSGIFVRSANAKGFLTKGFDINPATVSLLRDNDLFDSDPSEYDAITLWDSLEHMPDPARILFRRIKTGAIVCVAIPLMSVMHPGIIRSSKHYKKNEHLYYFTEDGFINWMAIYGFRLLEKSSHETDAGRSEIGAYAFKRDLPGYDEHIEAYKEMHSTRFYGSSATELHLNVVNAVVQGCRPKSILDYGCGRSDLAAHFWMDGRRRIARYDPAIPAFRRMPDGRFDLALVCDVMEHIPLADVDRVLDEVKSKSDNAFFTISLRLARAKLPDGRNAHVTLLTQNEWTKWLKQKYKSIQSMPGPDPMELRLLAQD